MSTAANETGAATSRFPTLATVMCMDPIYDSRGEVCGWRQKESLFDEHGSSVGFIHDDCVLNTRGSHVGWLDSGHFLDRRRDVVGWLRNANAGPSKPHTRMKPLMPPITSAVVGRLVGPLMARAAHPVTSWSALSWTEFLADEGRSPA